jgi:DNA repair ATPase RecN
MRIDRIRVRDMRAHAKWDHELEPGTVLFLGENGSGKSTVLLALAYALFGWAPNVARDDHTTLWVETQYRPPQPDTPSVQHLLIAQCTSPLLAHNVVHQSLVLAHQFSHSRRISGLCLMKPSGTFCALRGRIRHGVSPFDCNVVKYVPT